LPSSNPEAPSFRVAYLKIRMYGGFRTIVRHQPLFMGSSAVKTVTTIYALVYLCNDEFIVSAVQFKLNRITFLLEVLDLICLREGFYIV
jgi:hypothetical protein